MHAEVEIGAAANSERVSKDRHHKGGDAGGGSDVARRGDAGTGGAVAARAPNDRGRKALAPLRDGVEQHAERVGIAANEEGGGNIDAAQREAEGEADIVASDEGEDVGDARYDAFSTKGLDYGGLLEID